MKKSLHNIYLHTALAVLVFIGAVGYMLPYYGYYLDTDAVAYETIWRRYATGELAQAINGMWSPLQVWLLVPFYKEGQLLANHHTAVLSNAIICILLLVSMAILIRKSKLSAVYQIGLIWIWSICLLYFCYLQVFGDLLSCLLLIWVILLLLVKRKNYLHWAAIGIIGALSYFAKSYNFYYFPLLLGVVIFTDRNLTSRNKLLEFGYTIVCFFLVAYPWMKLLHEKYGSWTSSVSGKLNMTWYLVNHREFDSKISALVPPIYKDSPSYWEDPYWVQGAVHHATESAYLLMMKIARIAYNIFDTVYELSLISPFIVLSYVLALYIIVRWKKFKENKLMQILALAIVILPLGYVSVHVESRYLWLDGFLGSILLFVFLEKIINGHQYKMLAIAVTGIVALSFWAYPAIDLEVMFNKGKYEYETSMELKKNGFYQKRFISNLQGGPAWNIAYWTESQFYDQVSDSLSQEALESDMAKFEIEDVLRYSEGEQLLFETTLFIDQETPVRNKWTNGKISWFGSD